MKKDLIIESIAKRIIECQIGCYVNSENGVERGEIDWEELKENWKTYLNDELSALESLPSDEALLPDWSKPDKDGNIDVPDDLMPLFNKLGMQMRFYSISGKNEVLTIAHMTQIAHQFFKSVKYEKE